MPDAVRPPDIDEDSAQGGTAPSLLHPHRAGKAGAVEAEHDDIVLCADTTVAVGRRILGKPADADEAGGIHKTHLSGRRHRVITSVAVKTGDTIWQRDVVSTVKMKRCPEPELEPTLPLATGKARRAAMASKGPRAHYSVDQRIVHGHRWPATFRNRRAACKAPAIRFMRP